MKEQNKEKLLLDVIKKYDCHVENLNYILKEAQDIYQYIHIRAQKLIASKLGMEMQDLYRYIIDNNFLLEPNIKNNILVCFGPRCSSNKSFDIYNCIKKELDIYDNISSDNQFHLSTKRCFGYCAKSPVFTVNDDVYFNVNIDNVKDILKKYKS